MQLCMVKRESVKLKDSLSVQVRDVMYSLLDHNFLGVFDNSWRKGGKAKGVEEALYQDLGLRGLHPAGCYFLPETWS